MPLRNLFLWWLLALLSPMLMAQAPSSEQEVEEEIRMIEQLLAATKGEEKQTMSDINLLRRQINLRKKPGT